MSLEAQIAEMTAALKENTEQLKAANAGRADAIEAAKSLTGGETKARAGRPPKGKDGDAAKADEPKADEPKATVPSAEDVRNAGAVYLQAGDPSEDVLNERKAFVGALIKHLGCKPAEAPEEKRAEIIGWFEAKGRGERAPFEPEPEADDDLMG